jgi:hypothetical protein
VYGPYHDADDGRIDGKITLKVEDAEHGTWGSSRFMAKKLMVFKFTH